ncbi:cation:proton antiporter [Pseudoruegeria sp. HB172150]|uniref:cation:proton antiporter domain-containing protein n=1 Tax=Pseudoruegeria sp. HB172150 TaxID=2721164 RepID=UPI001551C072|nr:cation:proton antiporter [Pseudoruegeria sp. HB172150]
MDFLSLAFLFLIAGVVAVPIATRFGLGSVLGFLIAGIALGPVLAAFRVDVVSLQHFAEFGVVMMLFLVGLELEPKLLWRMKTRLLGLGGLQVGLTALAVMAAGIALGLYWTIALALGLVFALSSTAIVLQTLNEKGLMRSDGGQAGFSVLLFQDIAVIPMLALIPLLAMPELMDHATAVAVPNAAHGAEVSVPVEDGHGVEASGDHAPEGPGWIETIPGWQRALITVAAIAAVILGGSMLTRPLFRFVAVAQMRELFTATALLMVVGIALLMNHVGLSPALGTFLAGVVLANSEYRHELESDIDPFRGMLLGLFFMTVGAGIDFLLLWEDLWMIVSLTLGLMVLKAGILYGLGLIFRVRGADRWLLSMGLAQAGEFGFVLLSFTTASHVIPQSVADVALLVVALSMLLTPALFILYDRVVAPRFSLAQADEPDQIDEEAPIIIAGHGRFGGIVNRMLLGAGYRTVVLDHNSAQLRMMRAFNFKVFFGDASRPDLLHAAGIENAKLLVVAIDDRQQTNEIVHHVIQNYQHVHVIARARSRDHVYELWAAGCRDVIRETFDSGVRAGRSAFEAMGMHPFEAERMAQGFVDHDRRVIRELADLYRNDIPIHENEPYIRRSLELREETDGAMLSGRGAYSVQFDKAWSPPVGRDEGEEADEQCRRDAEARGAEDA